MYVNVKVSSHRYVVYTHFSTGTFGEKSSWQLTYPIKLFNLPRKAPPRLNKQASFQTIQTVSGPTISKWKLVNLPFTETADSYSYVHTEITMGEGLDWKGSVQAPLSLPG